MPQRDTSSWNDYCYVCGSGGDGSTVLCCDSERCPNVAHQGCLGITEIPGEDWYCEDCKNAKPSRKVRVLELFKGTGSVSKYCERYPRIYETVSLDLEDKFKPDHVTDIRSWNYSRYLPKDSRGTGYFDIIWASPPCTEFSILKQGIRDLETANEIVKATLEAIKLLKPRFWFLENPQTGLLKQQSYMVDIPYVDVDYCKYSDFGYRKRTRIWTNLKEFRPLLCKNDCGYSTQCGHVVDMTRLTQADRYRVPDLLIGKLFTRAVICSNLVTMSKLLHNEPEVISEGF